MPHLKHRKKKTVGKLAGANVVHLKLNSLIFNDCFFVTQK